MAHAIQTTRKRIGAIKSTLKITKAMQLVSTAKLKKARQRFDTLNAYTDHLYRCINELPIDEQWQNRYFTKQKSEKTFYIVITSNIGLCAGYNVNIIKQCQKLIKADDYVYVFGKKGISALRHMQVVGSNDENDFSQVATMALDYFDQEKVGELVILYTRFVNSLTFVATKKTLLPLKRPKEKIRPLLIEPSPVKVIERLVPYYLKAVINGYSAEADVSEQAARRAAMEQASDNATEIIDELKIEYNKARQQAITSEISEIVAGANS